MLSKGFKIVSPKTFEIDIEYIESKKNEAIIRIDYAAICKADLRYYLGNREERILGLKYPMRLIHEAVGTVLKDQSGKFKVGDKVILVPNICNCDECDFEHISDKALGANYCPKAKFASSNYDGFSSECISYPIKNLVKYDENIPGEIAVYSELISVAMAAIRRIDTLENKNIGIWGDGIVGYILAHVIKMMNKNCKVTCIGKNEEKLNKFEVDQTLLINDSKLEKNKFDLLFECVGGKFSGNAINQMIECAKFGADIVLTGVSEDGALINTRRILEKAVRITGTTRSTIEDFERSSNALNNEEFRNILKKVILSKNKVEDISDYYKVFERESKNTALGKHIMRFMI